jgi:hypothetical protein
MNVRQLINILKEMDPDMDVYFAYDSKDYWGSVITSEVNTVGKDRLAWSEYHRAYEVPGEDYEDDSEDDGAGNNEQCITVVLLSEEDGY